jgi:vacuolar protein sorting-associated protein 72
MRYNDELYRENKNQEEEEDEEADNKIKIKKEKTVTKKEKIEKETPVKYNFVQDKPSQKEILFEAIFTELLNQKSLEEMQRLEDMNKREMNTTNKKKLTEYVRIIKRNVNNEHTTNITNNNAIQIENQEEQTTENPTNIPNEKTNDTTNNSLTKKDNLVTFSEPEIYKKIFDNFNHKTEPSKHIDKVCSITGQPAKYYDPLTKQYYSSIESFKIIRERYFQKEEDGLLFRIQTLSDLASQKKERLKKLLLSNESTTMNHKFDKNSSSNSVINNSKNFINIINKYGILKCDTEAEKKVVSRNIISINY